MSFNDFANAKVRKCDWLDIGLIKLTVAAFVLLLAKLWPAILSLPWYWYAAVAVLAAIRPLVRIWAK